MSIITRRGNLSEIVAAALSERIESGLYAPGDKLPSSAELCEEFGVSRTVIREAVASLRLGGRVIARQGSGVFVTERTAKAIHFEMNRSDDIRSAMQILELRLGVEQQSVMLAARRRSPEALMDITAAYDQLIRIQADAASYDPAKVAEADYAFHMAIARATRNPHFPHVLEAVMREINHDLMIKYRQSHDEAQNYAGRIGNEHAAILAAISKGDEAGAHLALTEHLQESLSRYRQMLDER